MKWITVKKGNKYYKKPEFELIDIIGVVLITFMVTVILCNIL